VILSHGARANLFGCALSLLTGVPLVTVEHNVDSWRETSAVRNCLDRIIGLVSRQRIAVSQAVETMLVARSILPHCKIVKVLNGFKMRPPAAKSGVRESIRQRFGMPEDALVIVTVARFVEQKGHRFLVEAIPSIVNSFPDVRFLFLGDGRLFEAIRQQVQAAGVGQHVLMPGAIDDVAEVLAGCDLFVLPSLWEGLPVALLEAMGARLPVIATAVAGVPEVIQNGKTGVLIEAGDSKALEKAIVALLGNKSMRLALAHAGQEYVNQNHRIEGMTDHYVDVLQAATNSVKLMRSIPRSANVLR
jgi:glycosyltransferase involved in cell wall biosynthesis